MISNSEPGYFRALIEFERDPLPPASPASAQREAWCDLRRAIRVVDAGSAQPLMSRTPPSGGGCAEGSFPMLWDLSPPRGPCLSQLEPLETV